MFPNATGIDPGQGEQDVLAQLQDFVCDLVALAEDVPTNYQWGRTLRDQSELASAQPWFHACYQVVNADLSGALVRD